MLGTRVESFNNVTLGDGKDRPDIDVLLENTPQKYFVNIEVRNRMKWVTASEMEVKIHNSKIASEKWFHGKSVQTALVCSKISKTELLKLNLKGIPVAFYWDVYLPSGEHEAFYREYIREFEYDDTIPIRIVNRIPSLLMNRIDTYILKAFDSAS